MVQTNTDIYILYHILLKYISCDHKPLHYIYIYKYIYKIKQVFKVERSISTLNYIRGSCYYSLNEIGHLYRENMHG